ncbi:hypothetical protein [Erythrobacter sp. Alg231-14]|uniref:hypothetical protein n=1 Tax=Erythrobacter sp. Alg231-14 TaxID=1922225 RepID=UPI00307B68F2
MTGGKFSRRVSEAQSVQQGTAEGEAPPEGAPLGGTKSEATQRLQVGLFGIGSMVLLVGLASVLGNQADLTQEGAVPDAAPTTEPTEAASQRDPLADAGIVPDIPAEPSPTPTDLPADLPPLSAEDTAPVDDAPAP